MEWKVKGIAWRWRRLRHGPTPERTFDLDAVYRVAGREHPDIRPHALGRAFRNAGTPTEAIDASLAALALAVAAGHRPRIEGLVAFLELCYSPAALDAG